MGDDNLYNYIVATQDKELRSELRQIPGVPLLYINKSVVIFEPPSPATMQKSLQIEIDKNNPKEGEIVNENQAKLQTNRKKIKAPNSLSVKKKKIVLPVVRKSAIIATEFKNEDHEKVKKKRERKKPFKSET